MMATVQPISPKASFGYIPCFDGARCLAILMVFLSHLEFTPYIPGGFGVTVFFFISGLLITRLLLAEFKKRGDIKLPEFYLRRFFRLMPAMIFMIIATSVVYIAVWGRTIPFSEYASALLYYKNYFRYAAALGNGGYPTSVWGITWSLSIEEHFYLLFPAALILMGPLSKRAMYVFSALVVLPLILRVMYWDLIPYPAVYNYLATDARMDSILIGCCLALYAEHIPFEKLNKYLGAPWMFWASVAGIAATLLYREPFFQECVRYSVEQLFLVVIFFQIIYTPNHRWIAGILEWNAMRFIGRISYSIYLWHMFCLEVAHRYCTTLPGTIVVATSMTAVLACLSYFLIEMPFVNLRKRFGSHADKVEITPTQVLHASADGTDPTGEANPRTPQSVMVNKG